MKNTSAMFATLIFIPALLLAACTEGPDAAQERTPGMAGDTMEQDHGMGGMAMGEGYVPDSLARANLAPLVKAYYEGGEAFFIHTEVSDAEIAQTLTEMMGPQVVTVPELAQVPASLTAPIYVFENGVEGMGPLGYQPDILAAVPGDEGYSPLHTILLVRWNEDATPHELKSETELKQAESQGHLTIDSSGVVVNAPVLAGPKGHRGTMAGM